jgi:hypothetical protein
VICGLEVLGSSGLAYHIHPQITHHAERKREKKTILIKQKIYPRQRKK